MQEGTAPRPPRLPKVHVSLRITSLQEKLISGLATEHELDRAVVYRVALAKGLDALIADDTPLRAKKR